MAASRIPSTDIKENDAQEITKLEEDKGGGRLIHLQQRDKSERKPKKKRQRDILIVQNAALIGAADVSAVSSRTNKDSGISESSGSSDSIAQLIPSSSKKNVEKKKEKEEKAQRSKHHFDLDLEQR